MNKKIKKIINLRPLGKIRFKSIYFTSLILTLGLLLRLINLQVYNSSILKNKAIAIQVKKTNAVKQRRTIVDRHNRLIAFDKTLYKLWAHPRYFNFPGDESKKIRSIPEVIGKISNVLNID